VGFVGAVDAEGGDAAGQQTRQRAAARRLAAGLLALVKALGFVVKLVAFVAFVRVAAVIHTVSARGRKNRRIFRTQRRAAREIGAYEGHLLAAETGSGVFGEGPCWQIITTLRQGSTSDIQRAQLQRIHDAGYSGAGPVFPGTTSLPELRLTLISQRQRLPPNAGGLFAYPERRPTLFRRGTSPDGPVIVWGVTGDTDTPGTAFQRGGGKLRYSKLAPAVVPDGATVVLIDLGEPARPARPETAHNA
jgi:hypothetical protein